jgi:hypothetical protein
VTLAHRVLYIQHAFGTITLALLSSVLCGQSDEYAAVVALPFAGMCSDDFERHR